MVASCGEVPGMVWFKKPRYSTVVATRKRDIPDGLWTKCEGCGEVIYNKRLEENLRVCPRCGYHMMLTAPQRIAQLFDEGSFSELWAGVLTVDPLGFKDSVEYPQRIANARKQTGLPEAVVCGRARLKEIPVVAAVMDFRFVGGSMGSVVGEKVTRAAEEALASETPLLVVSCSGGARMQEGILSLMQMAKTAAAVQRLGEAAVPFISVLTHPTTGGVSASFAFLGDVIIAEPGALIGFAGPRVIKQTIKEDLPPGFQRAEFLLEHGMIDMIVHRRELRDAVASLLGKFLDARARAPLPARAVR